MSWKPILVKMPKVAISDVYIQRELEKIMKTPQQDFESFVGTFSTENKPKIMIEVKKDIKGFRAFTGVKSNWSKGKKANASDKFMFLTRGTSVRYATMSSDFKPKTSKGVLRSGSGGGRRTPLFVDTAYPQPGIEPREIEELVKAKRQGQIKREIQFMFIKGVILNKLGRI